VLGVRRQCCEEAQRARAVETLALGDQLVVDAERPERAKIKRWWRRRSTPSASIAAPSLTPCS